MKPKYLNKSHQKNSQAAMKYIAESKNRKINWEEEIERRRRNSSNYKH